MTGSQHDIPARWRRPCGKAGGPWSSQARASPPKAASRRSVTRSPGCGRASTRRPWPRQAFRAHPDLVWGWYEWRREQALRARPNAAHLAIARLAAHAPALTVITQNVDDLHERAGSRKYCICMAACTRRAAPIAARPGAAPSPRALTPRQPAQRQPIFGQPTPRPPARPRPARRTGNRTKAAASSRRAAPLAAVPCGQASSGSGKPARRRLARGPARRRAMRSAAEHRHLGPGLSRRGAAATRAGRGRRRRAGQSGRHANGCAREVQSARPGRRRAAQVAAKRGDLNRRPRTRATPCASSANGARMAISHAHHACPAAPAAITTCSRCP